MSDRLHEEIKRAINEEIDGTAFERGAVDLLRTYYPSARPLSGGNDAGQDGLFELPDGRRGFIASTTDRDYAGNLRKSVQSHLDSGGERRLVVLGTSRPVSGQMRERLRRELAQELGVTLHEVHDQGEFIDLLYRNSRWRKDLLGVPGVVGALTRIPLTAPPAPPMPRIGREAELERLRPVRGDLILVGKPGIGKTYLLEQLMEEDWGLFDALRSIPELEDAIRDAQPQRVIIDDAHLAPDDRVARVLHLRREMEGDFAVVVVSWPGYLDEAREQLPEADVVTIEELDREEIIEVIKAAGLSGPDGLLREINDQVRGRAGLAVMLARACRSGESYEVATGRRLLANLTHWYKRALPRLEVKPAELIGVLGLAGDEGVSTAEVAAALGESEPSVREAIRALASGGTIDEVGTWREPGVRRLILQPRNLRAAAIEQAFFSGPGSMEIAVAAGQLQQARGVGLVLTEAALRGAQISRDTIRRYLRWSDRQSAVAFGCLGEPELKEAVHQAPQHAVAIATEAYRAGVGSEFAISVLLGHALGPSGPLDKDSWDPLQVIARHLHGTRSTVEDRRLVVQITDEWLSDGGHPEVGARALKHAVHPGIDDSSLDPDLGDTIRIVRGVQSAAVISQMARLWDETLDVVARHPDVPIGPLIDALRDWFIPDRLLPDDASDISRELQITMRDTGERAVRQLAGIFADRPVVLRRLQQFVLHPRVDVDIAFAIPSHIDALVPLNRFVSGYRGDPQGWEDAAQVKVRALARETATLDPSERSRFILDSYAEVSRERSVTPQFQLFMTEIAEMLDDPAGLLDELEQLDAPWECREALLEKVVIERLAGWTEALARCVVREDSWPSVLLALRYPVDGSIKEAAVQRIDQRHAPGIETLIFRDELDEPTLMLMLESTDRALAAFVALTLGSSRGQRERGSLSEQLNERWREIAVSFCVSVSGSSPDDWRVLGILERDQPLLVLVIERWFEVLPDYPFASLPFGIEEKIANLPLQTRLALIASIPEGKANSDAFAVVEALVSDEVEAMRALFDRSELQRLHPWGLVGTPADSWMNRALLAMDHGWSASDIVSCSLPSKGGWTGAMSARWQERIDMFENLREELDEDDDARVGEIIDAGVEHFTQRRDSALAGERQRRVFGPAGR